jgi:CrcB protein
MNSIITLLAVAGGGALGATGRYLIAEGVRLGTAWPAHYATLAANLIGCFGIGVVYAHLESSGRPDWVNGLLVTGLLGAFTTFSTFSLDAMHLIHDRKIAALGFYVAASVIVGLVAVKLGMLVMSIGGRAA